jgi:hypothetical protein
VTEIAQIQLPDGQVIWARLGGRDGQDAPRDVGFGERAKVFAVEEFSGLAGAVIDNVRGALRHYQADEVSVDFGIELSLRSGKVISALAEIGATSSIVVHLSWTGTSADPKSAEPAASPG